MSIRKVSINYLVGENGFYFQDGDFVVLETSMTTIKGRILEIHDYRVKMEDEQGEIIVPIERIESIKLWEGR
ncbi:hypothetical protein F390_gp53 [Clostridium phage phiCP13O]|uniref:hypothetical protein n=1 Tax=Clostridium phage phiCP13O TaxID=1042122 RepID=UPI000214C743|nr:hypothetical protein F390_gp53 [Clostridium phage phiCP13O]AEI74479.1 hypothetical protein phi13O_gp53 [Clostridium phage phiCP13O]